jgi:hypothetical protein
MTRLRATRATTADGAVTIQASAMLMDDYVHASDINSANNLVSIQEPDGCYSLLYTGATQNIMLLRQDASSDTGWVEDSLGNDFPAGQVVGAVDGDGNLVVFAVGPNQAEPDIYWSRQSKSGWSPWQKIALDNNDPGAVQVGNLAAVTVDGVVGLWVLLTPGPNDSGVGQINKVTWDQASPSWGGLIDGTDQLILEPCTIAGLGPCLLFANTSPDNPQLLNLLVQKLSESLTEFVIAQSVSLTTVAIGTQADGNSAIFIADDGEQSGSRKIQYFDGSNPDAGFVTTDTNTTAATLLVTNAGTAPLTLFALDEDNVLNLVANPMSPTPGDDFDFSLKFAAATTAVNAQGDAELIGYTPGKGMIRMWANPAAEQGHYGWSQAPIEYQPANSTLTHSSTYATTMSFIDAKGLPIANQALELRASENMSAAVAGETLLLGPAQPVTVQTDARGQVRLTMPTASLGAPALSASMPALMATGQDFVVAPDAKVKNRLSNINTTEVAQFINPEYSKDPKSLACIQQHITKVMQNVSSQPFPTVSHRVNPRADLKTPLEGGIGQSHSLCIVNGQATCAALTQEEANARIAEIAGMSEGIFSWFEDAIEAVGNAMEDAVSWTYTNVVTPVVNGVQVAINFVAGAIKVVWSGIIETVEDAFRFVESVFDAYKTGFERLYGFFGWLLSGAKKDILATTQYFDTLLTQGYTALANYAQQAEKPVDGFFTGAEDYVSKQFGAIQSALSSVNANQAIDTRPPGAAGMADTVGETVLELIEDVNSTATWLFDKITGGSSFSSGLSFQDSVLTSGVQLVENLMATFGAQIQELLDAFFTKLESLASSTQNFGQMALSVLLEAAKDLLLAVLKMLDDVIGTVLKFFATNMQAIAAGLFGAAIGSGFVQAMYGLFFPQGEASLTVQGLACLLMGFTTTVVFEAVLNEVPFPRGAEALAGGGTFPGRIMAAGIIQAVLYMLSDVIFDAVQTPWTSGKANGFLGVFILFQLSIQLIAIPIENEPSQWTWAAWGCGFSVIALQVLWVVGMVARRLRGDPIPAVFDRGPRGTLAGSILLAVCGACSLGVNIGAAFAGNTSVAQKLSAILSPLSAIIKPVKHIPVIPQPYNAIIMGVVDVISDTGGGGAKIAMFFETGKNDNEVAEATVGKVS